jgi:hypothetical protein
MTEESSMNAFVRLLRPFVAPQQLFEHLREKPDWFLPFILVAIVTTAAMLPIYSIYKDFQYQAIDKMLEDGKLDTEQAGFAYEAVGSPVRTIFDFAVRPVFYLIILLVQALFFYLGANMLGGESTFKKSLAVAAYSSLVFVPGAIITDILILIKRDMLSGLNLAKILPADMAEGGLFSRIFYQLLSHFDVFQVWALVLMSIGIAVTMQLSKAKSYALIFVLWGIWIVISIVLAEVFGGLQAV